MSDKEEEATEGGKSSMKKMLIIGVGALLLVGVSVGATMFLVGGKEEPVAEGEEGVGTEDELPPLVDIEAAAALPKGPLKVFYYSMQPEFVVNIGSNSSGRAAFLMTELTVATYDEGSHEAMLEHDPQLRNELLTMFSEQSPAVLQTAQGKIALRNQAKAIIDDIVSTRYGAERIKDVFLTRFVVQ